MKRILFLLLYALAANSLPAETRTAIESPHLTLRQLGRLHRKLIPRDEEHLQRGSFASRETGSLSAAMRAESVTMSPSIPAPPETAGFRGSTDNGIFPSDAAGAVSASFLLSVTNASVVAQDRLGNRLSDISLADFWHDPGYTDGSLYDPRVSHDNATDRWIICTLYDVNFKKSTLLIAVSDGSNPSLGWRRYRFTIDPSDVLDADLTRMALTRDTIVVTANLFDGDLRSFPGVFTIRESDALTAPPTLPVTLTQAPPNVSDLVPVDNRDDGTPYFVVERGAINLAIYSFHEGTLTNVGNPDAPALNISNSSPVPDLAPQFGSSLRLNSGPMYVANAVLRSGTLWVATQPCFPSPLRSSVMWWRIVVTSPLRVDTGVVDDPTGATMYAFPSIAVNKLGAALLAYSVFKASIYPSAGYSYVDPLNHLSAPAILKSGEKPSPDTRWADFSTTVVDANDVDFWTTQTYEAATTAHWATWWGKVEVAAPPRRRAVRP